MNENNVIVNKRKMSSTGDMLSILGYGCMRFKRRMGVPDLEKAERQVRAAIDAGVNYFDTAWMYPGNEVAIGTILQKTDETGGKLRDRVHLATKLPIMSIRTEAEMEKHFNTSRQRLKTDRIDYYLLHNINTLDSWERMKKLGIEAFIEGKKKDGAIKHIGFSFHGNLRDFKIVVDDYPWEFIQIQLNYLDEYFQAGLEGLRYAAERGIGVIVMEPLRGGMLVDKMPPAAKKIMGEYRDGQGAVRSPAEWGLRWVWNYPEVTLALSGMNEDAHVAENVRIAADAEAGALTQADLDMIRSVKNVFETTLKVNCTGCAYCMPCPAGVNIPQCFAQYNSHGMFGGIVPKISYLLYTAPGRKTPSARASACKKCGQCEKKCPQQIPIMKTLDDVKRDLEKQPMKFFVTVGGKIMGR